MRLGSSVTGSSTLRVAWYSRLARMITRNSDSLNSRDRPRVLPRLVRSSSTRFSRAASRMRSPSARFTRESSATTDMRRASSSISS
jgi:hypothetical protein